MRHDHDLLTAEAPTPVAVAEGDGIGRGLEAATPPDWRLKMITNRGVKVYPDGLPETFCTDHWRCQFVPTDAEADLELPRVLVLLHQLFAAGYDVIKTEHLYTFDGERAYSLARASETVTGRTLDSRRRPLPGRPREVVRSPVFALSGNGS